MHPQAQARAAEAEERVAAAQERCARLEAMLRRASSVKATLDTKVCIISSGAADCKNYASQVRNLPR